MHQSIQQAMYRGLVSNLHACIDTGNPEEGSHVLHCAEEALIANQISIQQCADLEVDFRSAFPDYQ